MPPLDCITKMRGRSLKRASWAPFSSPRVRRDVASNVSTAGLFDVAGDVSTAGLFKVAEISFHYRLQVGVDYHRRGALVFAKLGKDLWEIESGIERDCSDFTTRNSLLEFANENRREIAIDSGLAADQSVNERFEFSSRRGGQNFTVGGGAFGDAET